MKTRQINSSSIPSVTELQSLMEIEPQLALIFGSVARLSEPGLLAALQQSLPGVVLAGCSTAGEISSQGVTDDELVVTSVHFDHPNFRLVTTDLTSMDDSAAAGSRLAQELLGPELHDVLVFGQGVQINGSALIEGFRASLPNAVSVSGGLAGDGGAFKQTFTISSEQVSDRQIVALGFYGAHSRVQHGSFHGWQPFGPARKVTRCKGNILYELDGEPALEVYKRYLGEYAKDLPGSGLLFPFEMLGEDHAAVGLIRTILGIDEDSGALVLAGDIVQSGYLKLMHASTDSLIDGAYAAAEKARGESSAHGETLAILVSCVGRKLVMGARVDEEVEAVAEVFGAQARVTGFYSNGEISPRFQGLDCQLHNQTMTITYLSELG